LLRAFLTTPGIVVSLSCTSYHYSSGNSTFQASFILLLLGYLFSFNSCFQQQAIAAKNDEADSLNNLLKIKKAYAQIDAVKNIIHSGDIITRTGADFTSESLRSLNQRDQTYSHCGIANIENDSIFVYHALGGDFNPDQKILRQPLTVFAQPQDNRGIGIFRFSLSSIQLAGVIATAKRLFAEGRMFDMQFDLDTDDHLYCAEFVYKSLIWGTGNKLQFALSHIKGFTFIGVDDLFLNPLCVQQARIVYK
jgi:hypothetical protein